jgi:hypothetical protein
MAVFKLLKDPEQLRDASAPRISCFTFGTRNQNSLEFAADGRQCTPFLAVAFMSTSASSEEPVLKEKRSRVW